MTGQSTRHGARRHGARRGRILSALLLLLVVWGGDLCAQESRIERAGDVLLFVLPGTALGSAAALEDYVGLRDFVYGFSFNVATTYALKRAIPKERPDGSDMLSFPSGHTSVSFQAASFVHFRYGLEYAWPAYAAAAFVGYSRVAARKHFMKDVAVGLALGIASSRLLTERRPDDEPGSGGALGAGVRVRFGGGLGKRISFGLMGPGG